MYSPGVVHPDDVGDAFKKQCKLVQVRFPVTYGTYFSNIVTQAPGFIFLFSGHEPIYFIENKEKTLRASYDRGTQIVDYMD